MSKGIDYSKWDHLEDSDSDEEQLEPLVTRLETPSRITTTPDGTFHVSQQQQQQQSIQEETIMEVATDTETLETESWTTNGGHVVEEPYNLYWSQDRRFVSLRFQLPSDIVIKHITLKWTGKIYDYTDRQAAVGSDNTASFQILQEQRVILEGDLPHPIHFNEDEEELDWEIDNDHKGCKYLLLTLSKALPMAGMTRRWNRPLKQVLPLETKETTTNPQFQQAWDQAHRMFKEKMARGEIPKHPSSSKPT